MTLRDLAPLLLVLVCTVYWPTQDGSGVWLVKEHRDVLTVYVLTEQEARETIEEYAAGLPAFAHLRVSPHLYRVDWRTQRRTELPFRREAPPAMELRLLGGDDGRNPPEAPIAGAWPAR